jgi:GNAT superfamily N-acetyltransferase
MKIRIRRYRAGDRKAVLAAFRSNVPAHFPASEERWLRWTLDEPDGPLFVVVDGEEVIGFGGYELSEFYHLGTLVFGLVRADRHGTGIGRLLLNFRLLHMAGRDRVDLRFDLTDEAVALLAAKAGGKAR